jgi:hypothetical protein
LRGINQILPELPDLDALMAGCATHSTCFRTSPGAQLAMGV